MSWSVVVCCVAVCCVTVCCGEHCHSPNYPPIKFTITSRRNQTGYRIAQVNVDQSRYEGEERAWSLEVDQHEQQCEEMESLLLKVTLTAPPRRPGQDFQFVPGLGYYKLYTEPQEWLTARQTCARERAHLLVVNSNEEFDTVKRIWDIHPKLFSDWRNDYVHIGISDLANEGHFITIFGESLNSTGYTKWGTNEPSHGKTANCGRLSRRGELLDSYCTNQLAFICEQEL